MNEKEKFTLEELRGIKMTSEEKIEVWNGVLRRVTDYPPGEYPFEGAPNTWDGVLRRKSDFPGGVYPKNHPLYKAEEDERGR
jgi:hypothetical protein